MTTEVMGLMLIPQELLQALVNQLTNRHLLRLWRTGAKIAVVTAKDDESQM